MNNRLAVKKPIRMIQITAGFNFTLTKNKKGPFLSGPFLFIPDYVKKSA